MASEGKHISIVALNGTNYPTWKVQCRMALIREGLWGIVSETEECPDRAEADKHAKFMARKDRALATTVLAVEPSLLYLLGDPEDPVAVWKRLSGQFQKKTWVNKLNLRKKLFTMKLSDSGSMKEYIRKMTEIFHELAVISEPITEEDQVVHILAGLPESYDVLVTALESGSETVPPWETVTERLLREEQKMSEKEGAVDASRRVLMAKGDSGSGKKQLLQEVGAFQEGLQKVCSVVGRIEEGKAEAAQQAIPGGNADQPCTRGYIEEGMDCGFGSNMSHVQ